MQRTCLLSVISQDTMKEFKECAMDISCINAQQSFLWGYLGRQRELAGIEGSRRGYCGGMVAVEVNIIEIHCIHV